MLPTVRTTRAPGPERANSLESWKLNRYHGRSVVPASSIWEMSVCMLSLKGLIRRDGSVLKRALLASVAIIVINGPLPLAWRLLVCVILGVVNAVGLVAMRTRLRDHAVGRTGNLAGYH